MAEEKENQPVPWQYLPFYRSLSEQILLFGVPKPVIVLNAVLAYIFLFNFHFIYIIPVCILVHAGSIYLAKDDDQFFDCLKKYIHTKNYYCT